MKIAVEGCAHGELVNIYKHIATLEAKHQYKVDLLLICGDFQAVRNQQDLQCMAVPDKYKDMREFYKYYTGEKTAPILTIIIGGNHEASNYMWELYHGGWVAPNIYFLGHAGSIRVNGLRISGASGIFNQHDFHMGHHEKVPYNRSTMRSIYHTREYNIRRLSLLPPDRSTLFLSHDWPASIEHHGSLSSLLARKKFFAADVASGSLGSPPLMGLLTTLRPAWWFSAHLHVKYEALVKHEGQADEPQQIEKNPDEIVIDDDEFDTPVPTGNPDEITIDDDEFDAPETVELPKAESEVPAEPPIPHPGAPETRFLALDKCMGNRQFLEVIDIATPSETSTQTQPILTYDSDWLAITRAFYPWLSLASHQRPFPDEATARALVESEKSWIAENIPTIPEIKDVQVFCQTAPGHTGANSKDKFQQPPWYTNPQTVAFCEMLKIVNVINAPPPGHAPSDNVASEEPGKV